MNILRWNGHGWRTKGLRWLRQGGALLCCLIPIISFPDDARAVVIISVIGDKHEITSNLIKNTTIPNLMPLAKDIIVINNSEQPKSDSGNGQYSSKYSQQESVIGNLIFHRLRRYSSGFLVGFFLGALILVIVLWDKRRR